MTLHPLRLIHKGISTFTDWYVRNGFYKIAGLRSDGAANWSGEAVNGDTASTHSAVWACRRLLSEAAGMIPLDLKQARGNSKRDAIEHPMYSGLKYQPNPEMTAMSFRESRTGHCVMTGNAFAKINRRGGSGEAIELWPLLPSQVGIDREKGGERRLVYVVKEGNSAEKSYTVRSGEPHDILHVPGLSHDGICGISVIAMAANSIGTALAGEKHVGRFFARGGRMPYNLKLTANQTWKNKEDAKKFREDWETTYADPHKAPILEPWVEYQQTGLNLRDSQMLESRQFTVQEICRWFQVSPHFVADLSHATFSNIENLAQQFVTFTLSGWLKRWEQNLRRCVLTPAEQAAGYYFDHNLNSLQKGNFETRMAGYSTALQNGFMSPNEVRHLEDMDSFEGGDDYHIQLNMQTLPPGTPTTSQQASLTKIGTASKGFKGHEQKQNGFALRG